LGVTIEEVIKAVEFDRIDTIRFDFSISIGIWTFL